MKTHRIILPAAWHALALRGVSRLLLPMRPQPQESVRMHCGNASWLWYGGERLRAAGYGADYVHTTAEAMQRAMELACPYRAGDRLALLEPWCYRDGAAIAKALHAGRFSPPSIAASRMPLAACRCFYRVASVEPVRISEISEAHARECGFRAYDPDGNGMMSAVEQARADWRSGEDWAWSVRVEKEGKRGN